MDTTFCLEALEEAFARHGKPGTFNADHGSHFTSLAFTAALKKRDAAIGMDLCGAWRDNVTVDTRLLRGR